MSYTPWRSGPMFILRPSFTQRDSRTMASTWRRRSASSWRRATSSSALLRSPSIAAIRWFNSVACRSEVFAGFLQLFSRRLEFVMGSFRPRLRGLDFGKLGAMRVKERRVIPVEDPPATTHPSGRARVPACGCGSHARARYSKSLEHAEMRARRSAGRPRKRLDRNGPNGDPVARHPDATPPIERRARFVPRQVESSARQHDSERKA